MRRKKGLLLSLNRENVRLLTARRLADVRGAQDATGGQCNPTAGPCTHGCASEIYYTCRGSCQDCSAGWTGYDQTCQGACGDTGSGYPRCAP